MTNAIKQFIQNGVQRDLQYGEPVRRAAGVAAFVAASNPTMTQAAGYSAADSYNAPVAANYDAPRRGTFASEEFKNFPTMPSQEQPGEQQTAKTADNFIKRIFARIRAKKADTSVMRPAGRYTRDNTAGIKSEPQTPVRTKNTARAGINGVETQELGSAGHRSDVPSFNFDPYTPPPQAPVN